MKFIITQVVIVDIVQRECTEKGWFEDRALRNEEVHAKEPEKEWSERWEETQSRLHDRGGQWFHQEEAVSRWPRKVSTGKRP